MIDAARARRRSRSRARRCGRSARRRRRSRCASCIPTPIRATSARSVDWRARDVSRRSRVSVVVGRVPVHARVRALDHDVRQRLRAARGRPLSRRASRAGSRALGFRGRFLVMSSSGGTLTPAHRAPVSGAAARIGPGGGRADVGAPRPRRSDRPQVLSFDMGGTTAKGCIDPRRRAAQALRPRGRARARVQEGSGLPVKIPVIDMIEIGAGGGSLAAVDERGVLASGRAAPAPIPARPATAAAAREPTLTDANLVLGYLDPGVLPRRPDALDPGAARDGDRRTRWRAARPRHRARRLGHSRGRSTRTSRAPSACMRPSAASTTAAAAWWPSAARARSTPRGSRASCASRG